MIRRPCSGFCEAAHTCQRFSPYRSTGPGIGAAAWAAQEAHAGVECEQDVQPVGEADTDFEQDEHLLMWPQPARPTTRKRATSPNKRVRDM